MSALDDVQRTGQAYINALAAHHRALQALDRAKHQVDLERAILEDAHTANEEALRRRAQGEVDQ